MNSIRNFFAKIQNSSESVRRRWLVILSSLSMLFVITLWVGYINVIVKPADIKKEEVLASPRPNFTQVIGAGIKIVARELGTTATKIVRYLRRQLSTANVITILDTDRNFILDTLDEIPKTPLP